jgi:hypothetical protein
MVGATPPYHGIHENANYELPEAFITLAVHLRENGYSTVAFTGAFPLDSRFGLSQGFDVYDEYYPSKAFLEFNYKERNAGEVIQAALDWLDELKRKKDW